MFKEELFAGSGPITIWINSPGGDVFAAAQIYNMLMDLSLIHIYGRPQRLLHLVGLGRGRKGVEIPEGCFHRCV